MPALDHAPVEARPGRPYDWADPYDHDTPPAHTPSKPGRAFNALVATGAVSLVIGASALVYKMIDTVTGDGPIRADDVPAALPRAVARKAESAVKVEYNADLPSAAGGSGVKVGPDIVLTAGHVVSDGPSHEHPECAASYVMNRYTADLGWEDYVLNQNAIYDSTYYDAYDSTYYDAGHDIAALRIQRTEAFNALPTARLADERPKPGDAVFFVNYESSGKNPDMQHYPRGTYTGSTRSGYDYPAQYAGIVIDAGEHYMAVATGEAGYGPKAGRELDTHPGASGGPVFNDDGELVGQVIATDFDASTEDISRYNGIELQPDPADRPISIIQPVDEELLRRLVAGLPKTPAC